MSTDGSDREQGQSLLARISTEMVRAKKEDFGKGPTRAKSYFLDDMLVVVMRGGLTTAERTLIDVGEEDKVREFRQVFQNQMALKLTGLVEELTGRKVLTYQSQIMFGPDRVVEMFVLDGPPDDGGFEATAEGQLRGEPVGEVHGDEVSVDSSG